MKKVIVLTAISIIALSATAQQKADTTAKYRLTETEVIQISQLLDYGLKAAANSEKVSTAAYNQYAAQVAKVDSSLRVQYQKQHPTKEQPKK